MFSAALYARVRFYSYILHTRPRVQRASGIPCSLLFRGRTKRKPRAQSRREIEKACFKNTRCQRIKRCRIFVRAGTQRPARVQFSPPQIAPRQPSTFSVSGDASETWLT